jgi:hypothetical protein
MNAFKFSLALRYRSKRIPSLCVGICLLLLSGPLFSASPDTSSASAKTPEVVLKAPMTKADSVQKAKADATELADTQRSETINTVLTVTGSVLAIVILLFLTWKLSNGASKAESSPKRAENQRPLPHHGQSHRALHRK